MGVILSLKAREKMMDVSGVLDVDHKTRPAEHAYNTFSITSTPKGLPMATKPSGLIMVMVW